MNQHEHAAELDSVLPSCIGRPLDSNPFIDSQYIHHFFGFRVRNRSRAACILL